MDARGRITTIVGSALLAGLSALLTGLVVATPTLAAAQDEPKSVAITEFFKGKVVRATKKGEVEIHYDFEDATQLADFELNMPYRAIMTAERALERGQLRLKGTGSLRHKAVFSDEIGVQAALTPMRPRDFGFAVTEERESEVFTLYCIRDQYFSLGDGVTTEQNMVIKFIPRDPKVNKDGMQDWRYCGSRGPNPDVQRNVPLEVRVERGGNQSEMWFEGFHSKGKEAGRDLSTQMAAVYVHESDVKIDDLIVKGTLSSEFIERHGLDLSVEIEPEDEAAEAAEPELDPEVAAKARETIAAYPLSTKPPVIAKLLRDATLPEALRQEAVDRILTLANKRIVPFLVDGLYAEEEAGRRLTFDAIQGLLGKSFGYRPGADEERRRKAISALNDYIAKHRRDFQ